MAQLNDFIVNHEEENNDVLRRKIFDVNIRLYLSNKNYYDIVNQIIEYMSFILFRTKFTDYTSLKGISGANVGIPFNIVIVKKDENIGGVYLNPKYKPVKGAKKKKVKSNCGSINLEKEVTVKRYDKIIVSFYNRNGNFIEKEFDGTVAYTLQHEIDHNNGTLITDISI